MSKYSDIQGMRHVGVPMLGVLFFLLLACCVGFFCMKAQPLFTLDGNMRIISIALMVCCGVQVFLALFYLFATFQFTGMTLMFIPFLGIWGARTVDPNYIVFFVAMQSFYLVVQEYLPTTLPDRPDVDGGASQCAGYFGRDNFCTDGLMTFLTFDLFCYQILTFVNIAIGFHLFSALTRGSFGQSSGGAASNSDVHQPLLGGGSSGGGSSEKAQLASAPSEPPF